jgi:putative phage-type endonuclease
MEQRTDEWFAARLGKVTGSRVSDVMAKTKSGYSATRANYMAQLICERLTGVKAESFTSAAMEWGVENEPLAVAAYEAKAGVFVEPVGFIEHPTIALAGASPDGFTALDGLIEIKCPNSATHIDTLLNQDVDSKYIKQMQWQMACTGRQWCDFVSFDPRLPENLQLFVKRIPRDEAAIAAMEMEVTKFLAELATKVQQLEKLR